jgi:hypothetical protein
MQKTTAEIEFPAHAISSLHCCHFGLICTQNNWDLFSQKTPAFILIQFLFSVDSSHVGIFK